MAIKVKATKLGFYGGVLRYEDDVFDVAKESELGSWMEPITEKKEGKAKGKKEPDEDQGSESGRASDQSLM